MSNAMLANASVKKIAPWLEPIWDGMNSASFPNAVLIHGQSGIGKFEFSIELARALLCETSAGTKPCSNV
jgi:DNA polymerase-3 subunit delta'